MTSLTLSLLLSKYKLQFFIFCIGFDSNLPANTSTSTSVPVTHSQPPSQHIASNNMPSGHVTESANQASRDVSQQPSSATGVSQAYVTPDSASGNDSTAESLAIKERHFGISEESYTRSSVCNHRDINQSPQAATNSQEVDESRRSSPFGDRSSRLRRSNASIHGRRPNVRDSQRSRASLEGNQRSSPDDQRSSEGQTGATSGEGASNIWERQQQNQGQQSAQGNVVFCSVEYSS